MGIQVFTFPWDKFGVFRLAFVRANGMLYFCSENSKFKIQNHNSKHNVSLVNIK